MKKLLLLLTALLTLGAGGAWADTVTVTSESALWETTGTWTASYGSWGTTWKSTNGKVCVTSSTAGYLCKTSSQIATTNVTIWTPDDDVMITGYSITFTSNADANSIIKGGALSVTSSGKSDTKTFSLTGLYCHNALFNVGTNWANVSEFTITYETLPAQSAEGYYLIKNYWNASNNYYLSANPETNAAKIYKHKVSNDDVAKLGTNCNYVWKITSYGDYRMIQNVGTGRYITNFNVASIDSKSKDGSAVNILNSADYSDAEVFTETDRSSIIAGAIAYRANTKNGDCWLNCYNSTDGGAVGFHSASHEGDRMLLTRVYKITFNDEAGTKYKEIYTSGGITTSELEDFAYTIGGVAKTKDEVVSAINAVTDDNLVVVCSRPRSATISSKAEIDPTKVYTITVERDTKWMYAAQSSATYKTFFSSGTLSTFNKNNYWAFVTVDGGDNYYLYNVGTKRFVMSKFGDSNFMESKFTIRPISIYTTGDANYPLGFQDGSYTFNENSGSLIIDGWTSVDTGNKLSVQTIEDVVFDPTEAQALINEAKSRNLFRISPEPSGSFDASTTWYNISMRPGDGNGGYYAYYTADDTNIPLATTTGTKEETDAYRWCITGSMENGYRLYNKAAGYEKVFVFDEGGKIKTLSGNESASLFYLACANSPSNVGAPTFVFASTDARPNRQSNTISTWSNSDTGSEFGFTFDEAYDGNNFYEEYVEKVKPYMDAPVSSNYFCLTNNTQKTNIWNTPDRYSDGVEHDYYSHDDVTAMRSAVDAYLKKPIAASAVRLKNNKTAKYASYGTPTWNAAGLICNETYEIAEADLTSVLQFIPVSASTYYIYMPAQDKYLGTQTSGNTAFPLVEEASRAEFTLVPTNTPGVISIYNVASYVDANFQGYLHSAGWSLPGIVNWQSSAETSYWNIEDAGSICFDMITPVAVASGDVYMSYANNLGLPLKAPDGTSVFIITSQDGEKAIMSEVDSKEVPAGRGVILKSESGSTVHMTIKSSTEETLSGNLLVAGDGSTNVGEGNFMLAYNSTDEIAKFYAIGASGFVVPANKAYLPKMGATVKALELSFGETDGINSVQGSGFKVQDSEIYTLSGQRVSKPTRGLYIVNGKKVVIK